MNRPLSPSALPAEASPAPASAPVPQPGPERASLIRARTAGEHVMSGELCPRCAIRYLDRTGKCPCLPRAPGDNLCCAELTREAAIELMNLCGGILAGIIRDKLESLRKPDGPSREIVIAWLCQQGFAWRPRNAASEARLTPKGRAKAQSVLIHVSAGNY